MDTRWMRNVVCWTQFQKVRGQHFKGRQFYNRNNIINAPNLTHQNLGSLILKWPYHQNFYFSIWSYISCNEHLRRKFFDLDKKRFCYECLKTENPILAVDPCCDVDSGTCDFRFDLSSLFYLCKFSFMVHAKCSFPTCCMNYRIYLPISWAIFATN